MVSDDAACAAVTDGEHGIAAGLAPGGLLSPAARSPSPSHDRSRNVTPCMVSDSSPPPCSDAHLRPPTAACSSSGAGGDDAIDPARPVFDSIDQRVFVLGDDPSRANLLKLSLNALIFSTIEQMAEMFALNDKAGTAPDQVLEMLLNSFFNAPVHRNYGTLIVERRFDNPNASITLAAKDTRLLLEAGDTLGVPLPIVSLVRDRLLANTARGGVLLDFASLSDRAREDAGLPVV